MANPAEPLFLLATYQVRPGQQEAVEAALATLRDHTRQEPGNLYYQVHRVPDHPGRIHLYKIYRNAAALEAHRATEHFQRYLLGDVLPRLESRQGERLQPLPPTDLVNAAALSQS
ncbi:putative quinol monooxygenase [Hymenobacter terrenus]|uniref:putative quinol monooxygenase n=1 Tax=Hymenobacter terrenus TaxID=1629124 RepID=UPI00061928F1|nr:putative quinol monooxygenase [Hymenobacter terrenus]